MIIDNLISFFKNAFTTKPIKPDPLVIKPTSIPEPIVPQPALDVMVYDPNSRLSKYFLNREVGKSSTASRLNIDNTPSPDVLHNARELAYNVLDPIREQFGPFSPQSWYRSEQLEKTITVVGFETWCKKHKKNKDHPDSWNQYFVLKSHPQGQAADIEIVGVDNDELFNWIADNLEYDQLIREFRVANNPSSGWVHVSWAGVNNRKQKFNI